MTRIPDNVWTHLMYSDLIPGADASFGDYHYVLKRQYVRGGSKVVCTRYNADHWRAGTADRDNRQHYYPGFPLSQIPPGLSWRIYVTGEA